MDSIPWEHELAVAQAAVVEAAKLTKRMLSSVRELSKADSSPVTIADFAAQALLIKILRAEFPSDGFVGEEDASKLREDLVLQRQVHEVYSSALTAATAGAGEEGETHNKSATTSSSSSSSSSSASEMLDLLDLGGRGTGGPRGRFWAMDPVDGTATFLTGEQYAVSLALVRDGQEVLAAIVYPNLKLDDDGRVSESSIDRDGLGAMVSAVKGHGAQVTWLPDNSGNSSSSSASRTEKLPLSLLSSSSSSSSPLHVVDCHRNRASHRAIVASVCKKLGAPFPGTDVWSSHVRYASLVLGGGDFLLRIPARPDAWSCIWDHAGAQLIYREVGGKITDLDGRDVDFGAGRYLSSNRGLVLAAEHLHASVLAAARDVIGDAAFVS